MAALDGVSQTCFVAVHKFEFESLTGNTVNIVALLTELGSVRESGFFAIPVPLELIGTSQLVMPASA